jgi:signal transduction histidine kinase
MNIFRSAALKLTAWYLALIMLVSITCSFALYNVSSNDLENNNQRRLPRSLNELLTPNDLRSYSSLRAEQLDSDLNHLKGNLISFNLLVLLLGGAAAYALARRTLEPIEESLESQKRFTSDASHELRTPLTAMQAEIEVALRDASLTKAQAKELLQSNLEEVAKLKALSEGLLHLAHTSKPTELQPTELKPAILEAIEGYGLGLAIAKKLADSMNGVITVKSAPDHGSTFTISLPNV